MTVIKLQLRVLEHLIQSGWHGNKSYRHVIFFQACGGMSKADDALA